MSLDGYIAGPREEIDWIVMDPDLDSAAFAAFNARFDTVLLGRKSYDFMRRHHGSAAMPGMEMHVISRTLRQEDCPDAIVSADPAATLATLQTRQGKETGKDIWCFGGGELFRSLLSLGLVDTVELAVIPVLLGGGLPLLPPPGPTVQLQLLRQQAYPKSGTVLLEYTVNNSKTLPS